MSEKKIVRFGAIRTSARSRRFDAKRTGEKLLNQAFAMLAALALGASCSMVVPPPLGVSRVAAARPSDLGAARRSTRRDLLAGGLAAIGSFAAVAPAHASYAMYQSSYDDFQDRKKTGYVPVATSDRETLAQIQADIRKRRPQSSLRPERAPQYCAGQTSAVTPMLENVCANIGVSKADQSNTMTDACAHAPLLCQAPVSFYLLAEPPPPLCLLSVPAQLAT